MSRWIVTMKQYAKNTDIYFGTLSLEVYANSEAEARVNVFVGLEDHINESVATLGPQTTFIPNRPVLLLARPGCKNIITKVERVKGT